MKYCLFFILCILGGSLTGQMVTVNGYVFESGNRGYLNQVQVSILEKSTGEEIGRVTSNEDGYFEISLPSNQVFIASAYKQLFKPQSIELSTKNVDEGKKQFVKIQMVREPGYDFEVTLAPKRLDDNIAVDAIRGAWIEVYNNTTKEEVLNLRNHPDLEFNVHFDKGNHYTIMIRKDGFFTKRMEAYVNVEGCILCFDGVGEVQPGVLDNLSEGNEMGVLLANVELEPLFSGKTFEVKNIYYDFTKATLRPEAKRALKNLAAVLKDNPNVAVELGSHTDSRGTTEDNQKLSQARAMSAVEYLVQREDVPRNLIVAAGYGESQLVNHCSDGVACSEEDHQKNRRTEIKVLDISEENKIEKTLAEIRAEEEFIKSVLEGDIETKVAKVSAGNASDSMKKEVQIAGNENEEASEIIEESFVKLSQESSSKKKESDNVDRVISAETISKKQMPQIENNPNQRSVAEQRKKYNEIKKQEADKFRFGDYTGYKVVVHFSKEPISADHGVYQSYGDLVEYNASSESVLYMTGDFETLSAAEEFMNNTVSTDYPNAYVVQFENGHRLK